MAKIIRCAYCGNALIYNVVGLMLQSKRFPTVFLHYEFCADDVAGKGTAIAGEYIPFLRELCESDTIHPRRQRKFKCDLVK